MVLMDINMPEMDGFETTKWIKNNAPDIKVLVLSRLDDDNSIIKMLQYGAKGYILKDSKPDVLRTALREVSEKGFFLNEVVSNKLVHLINKGEAKTAAPAIATVARIADLRLKMPGASARSAAAREMTISACCACCVP